MPPIVGTAVYIDTILFETDAADLVLARDVFGATYLCVLTTITEAGHHYLAVRISSDRLRALREGHIDLRTVFVEPEHPEHHAGWLKAGDEKLVQLEVVDSVPHAWLPGQGFLLTNFTEEVSAEVVVQEAIAKNAAVIVCGWDPPESRGTELKIDADHLVKCISDFQLLVKRATMSAIKAVRQTNKKAAFPEDAYALQVFAVSPGSFNVHFRSKDSANLIGTSIVGTAMSQIDALMELSQKSPDEALRGLEASKGVILAAYKNVMDFVADTEIPFKYRWSQPAMTVANGHSVSVAAAKSMAALLKTQATLQVESFEVVARFTSVNTDRLPYSWTAHDADDKVVRGLFHEDSPDVIDGVTIKAERYVLSGEERLVRPVAGRPTTKLFLKAVRKAD